MKRNEKLLEMFNEQSGFCAYCKQRMDLELGKDNTAEIDHVVPRSVLRSKDIYDMDENLVAACHMCNNLKSDMPVRHWLFLAIPRWQIMGLDND